MVSEPGAVATGSGSPLRFLKFLLIRSLPLPVLTQKPLLSVSGQRTISVEAELPEKERPDIRVTFDGSAHITIAVVSGMAFSAQKDGPV